MTTLWTKLAKTWARHPLVAFSSSRRQIAFYRQFHALVRAGLGMPAVFDELSKYAPEPGLERALKVVAKDIQAGETLAKSLSRHAAIFDDANVELIAFAEEAGTLDTVLKTLTDHLEQVNKLRWRAVFMSLWPMYLAFAFIFAGPLLQASQAMSGSASAGQIYVRGLLHNLLLTGSVIAALVSFPFAVTLLGAEIPWDTFKRRAPIVAKAVRDIYASRLLLGLGLGVGAGLEVMRTLKIAIGATSSPSLIEQLPAAERVIRSGGTLTGAIASLDLLDRVTLGQLSVAERTGTIDITLAKLSQELQESSLRAIRILIIVVLALAAGVLLVGIVTSMMGTIFGPIKHLYDAAGSGDLDNL